MMVEPGLMRPVRSASETMRYAMRSFTDPPALKNSHLASAVYEMIHVSGSVGQQGVQGGSQRSCSTQAGATQEHVQSSHSRPSSSAILLMRTRGVLPAHTH